MANQIYGVNKNTEAHATIFSRARIMNIFLYISMLVRGHLRCTNRHLKVEELLIGSCLFLYNIRASFNLWNHIQQLMRWLLVSLQLKIGEIIVILVKHFVGSFIIEPCRCSLSGMSSFVWSVVFESLVRTVIVRALASTGVVIVNGSRSSRLL